MSKKRRNHSPSFKAKVAIAALKGDRSLHELSQQYQVANNLISKWKRQLIDNSDQAFSSTSPNFLDKESEIKELHAKIGKISMENDFLSKALDR